MILTVAIIQQMIYLAISLKLLKSGKHCIVTQGAIVPQWYDSRPEDIYYRTRFEDGTKTNFTL